MRDNLTDLDQVTTWLENHDFEYEVDRDRTGRQSYALAKIPVKILKNFNDEDQVVDTMIQFDFLCGGDRDENGNYATKDEITRVALLGLLDFICDTVILSEDCITVGKGRETAHDIYIYNR